MTVTSAQFAQILAHAGLIGAMVLGVVRGPGGSSCFVSTLRFISMQAPDAHGLRRSLPFSEDLDAMGDGRLSGESLGIVKSLLLALGKHDLSPILPFRIIGGLIDDHQVPRLLLEFWPDQGTMIAISGSMGIISEISSVFTGLDRRIFRSLADVKSSVALKLVHLWKSHVVTSQGAPEICFIDFVIKFSSALPLFTGCWEDGSTLGIKLRPPTDGAGVCGIWGTDHASGAGLTWILHIMLWGFGLFSACPNLFFLIDGQVARYVEFIAMKIRASEHQRSNSAQAVKDLYIALVRQNNLTTPGTQPQWRSGRSVLVDFDRGVPCPNGVRGALRCVWDLVEIQLYVLKHLATQPVRISDDGLVIPRCPVPPGSELSFEILERQEGVAFQAPFSILEVEQGIHQGRHQKAHDHWKLWGLMSPSLAISMVSETQRSINLQADSVTKIARSFVDTAGPGERGDSPPPIDPEKLTMIRIDPLFTFAEFERSRIKPDCREFKELSASSVVPMEVIDPTPVFNNLSMIPKTIIFEEIYDEALVVNPSTVLTHLWRALLEQMPRSSSAQALNGDRDSNHIWHPDATDIG